METIQIYSNIGDFAKWLGYQLMVLDMTPAKLAKISGVHPNTIRNYLAGRCEPTLYNAVCIVHALGFELMAVKQ